MFRITRTKRCVCDIQALGGAFKNQPGQAVLPVVITRAAHGLMRERGGGGGGGGEFIQGLTPRRRRRKVYSRLTEEEEESLEEEGLVRGGDENSYSDGIGILMDTVVCTELVCALARWDAKE